MALPSRQVYRTFFSPSPFDSSERRWLRAHSVMVWIIYSLIGFSFISCALATSFFLKDSSFLGFNTWGSLYEYVSNTAWWQAFMEWQMGRQP